MIPHVFRHVGDLGNILADVNGSTITEITDDVISLTGQYSIVNRTVDVSMLITYIMLQIINLSYR